MMAMHDCRMKLFPNAQIDQNISKESYNDYQTRLIQTLYRYKKSGMRITQTWRMQKNQQNHPKVA